MDGKHITVECPVNSGSSYFTYKRSFNIVLLAMVDANYKFLYVDVGCNWIISDGRNSSLSTTLSENRCRNEE